MKDRKLPLEGLRILELAILGAVPLVARQLGVLGAEVIRIETSILPDQARIFPNPRIPMAIYPEIGAGKKAVSIDVRTPKGQEIFARLVKTSDIYTTNWPLKRLREWHADYDSVKSIKPDIIMLWGAGCGYEGPYSTYKAYGGSLQAICAVGDISALPGKPPVLINGAFADWHAPVYSSTLILSALERRRRTGEGACIEVPLFESGVCFQGAPILEYTVNNNVISHIGNSHPSAAPHSIYPCKGDDRWCAIAVFTEEEWQGLCNVIGKSYLKTSPKFATLVGRLENQEELDRIIAEWTREHSPNEVMEQLQEAGVSAGIVAKGQDLAESPHLRERKFYQETEFIKYPGTKECEVLGSSLTSVVPFKLSKVPLEVKPTRRIGEDTEQVLRTLLKLSSEEVENLRKEGAVVD
jgi:crotonobetainyl-CoA:carnitine CoA-transferase CaiB-like acyl-CoA transferase